MESVVARGAVELAKVVPEEVVPEEVVPVRVVLARVVLVRVVLVRAAAEKVEPVRAVAPSAIKSRQLHHALRASNCVASDWDGHSQCFKRTGTRQARQYCE